MPHMRKVLLKETSQIPFTGEERALYDVVWKFVRRRHKHPLFFAAGAIAYTCALCKRVEDGVRWLCEECDHTLCEECFYIRYL